MRTIFLSGPHGSGKTTLINKLLKLDMFEENSFDLNFLQEFQSFKSLNNFERTLIRLYHRYFLTQYNINNEREDKIKLVSRGLYDSIAYIETYQHFSMFECENQYEYLKNVINKTQIEPYTIILNPDVDVIMYRLEKRRKAKQRPDRDGIFAMEDTREFLIKMTEIFDQFKNDKKVLYLTDNEEKDIERILSWVNEINNQE